MIPRSGELRRPEERYTRCGRYPGFQTLHAQVYRHRPALQYPSTCMHPQAPAGIRSIPGQTRHERCGRCGRRPQTLPLHLRERCDDDDDDDDCLRCPRCPLGWPWSLPETLYRTESDRPWRDPAGSLLSGRRLYPPNGQDGLADLPCSRIRLSHRVAVDEILCTQPSTRFRPCLIQEPVQTTTRKQPRE